MIIEENKPSVINNIEHSELVNVNLSGEKYQAQ